MVGGAAGLFPEFPREVLETFPDGRIKVRDRSGALVIEKPGTVSIPSEVGHTLEDRASWDAQVEPRMRWTPERVDRAGLDRLAARDAQGGPAAGSLEDKPRGLWAGSLYGAIRDMLGVENCAYLQIDDPDLYAEIIDRVGSLALALVDATLTEADARGVKFDFAHYWEDICFKNGPLISPVTFDELVGPWYRKISDRLAASGVTLCSLDCDGMIDALLPTWIKNGVNIMFPIEVGTWRASIAPWREKYGREIRGVGGMEKLVFSRDRAAVDAEIDRLARLVDLGGYIPCPDHRIPPDAEWSNVVYYCEAMRRRFK
jgi:uroporphyrinogen decarboxylase